MALNRSAKRFATAVALLMLLGIVLVIVGVRGSGSGDSGQSDDGAGAAAVTDGIDSVRARIPSQRANDDLWDEAAEGLSLRPGTAGEAPRFVVDPACPLRYSFVTRIRDSSAVGSDPLEAVPEAEIAVEFVMTDQDGPWLDDFAVLLSFFGEGEPSVSGRMGGDPVPLALTADDREIVARRPGPSIWRHGHGVVGLGVLIPPIPDDGRVGSRRPWSIDRGPEASQQATVRVAEWIDVDGHAAVVLRGHVSARERAHFRSRSTVDADSRTVVLASGRVLHAARTSHGTGSARVPMPVPDGVRTNDPLVDLVSGFGSTIGVRIRGEQITVSELRLIGACDGPVLPDFPTRAPTTAQSIARSYAALLDAARAGDTEAAGRLLAPEVLAAHGDSALDLLTRHLARLGDEALGAACGRAADDDGTFAGSGRGEARDVAGERGTVLTRCEGRIGPDGVVFTRIGSQHTGRPLLPGDTPETVPDFDDRLDLLNLSSYRLFSVVDALPPAGASCAQVIELLSALGSAPEQAPSAFSEAVIGAHGEAAITTTLSAYVTRYGPTSLTDGRRCLDRAEAGARSGDGYAALGATRRYELQTGDIEELSWGAGRGSKVVVFATLDGTGVRLERLLVDRTDGNSYPRFDEDEVERWEDEFDTLAITSRRLFASTPARLDAGGGGI